MKFFTRYSIALLAVLLFSLGTFAQTATPPAQPFVLSTSSASYNGTAGAKPVMILSTGFQATSNVSLVYESISNPSDTTVPRTNSGLVNYTRELAAYLPKSVKSKLVFDPTNYLVTLQAGVGRQSLGSTSHIVGNFGAYLSRPVANNVQMGGGFKEIVGPRMSLIKVPVANVTFTF